MTDPRQADSSSYAAHWTLDPSVAFLNHGSFGACPRAVLEVQQRFREQMEREPVRFFMREVQPLLEESRGELARFVGAEPSDLAFVANATTGVNSVLRSLRFAPGDELLVTNHEYNACRNAMDYVAERRGARIVVARIPLPIESADQVVEAVVGRATERTRLAMLDHVTSPTALVFPIERIVRRLAERGIDTLVDGAHAPGMIPLELDRLGAAYYTGNCHKWLCAPKGAGFLHVRGDRQEGLHPAVISHGLNTNRPDSLPLHDEFDWTGTSDPSAWLCVGESIHFLEGLMPGGMSALIERNHRLALRAREILRDSLGTEAVCPAEMIGSMAVVSLPEEEEAAASIDPDTTPVFVPRLQTDLLERYGIEIPIYYWPAAPRRLVRLSAQAYNDESQYERLAEAFGELLS